MQNVANPPQKLVLQVRAKNVSTMMMRNKNLNSAAVERTQPGREWRGLGFRVREAEDAETWEIFLQRRARGGPEAAAGNERARNPPRLGLGSGISRNLAPASTARGPSL